MRLTDMRLTVLLLLILNIAMIGSAAEQPLEPNSLLNWLKIIDVDGYRLLHASDQNGFYFAVKRDVDGDILFCHHEQSKGTTSAGTNTIRIADPVSGVDLKDPQSKKSGPDPVILTQTREVADGVVRVQTAVKVAYPAGEIYPLTNRNLNLIHINWLRENDRHEKTTLFDQLIQLPKPPR